MSRRHHVVPAALAVLVAVVSGVLLSALPAAAAVRAQAPPTTSYLRLAHLSPDTPNVDVYLTGVDDPSRSLTVPGVGYGAVSDYRALPIGTYTVAMRSSGAPADSPPIIATTLSTEPGRAYTVAGTGPYTELGLTVLNDELTAAAADQARVRVINAAATAPRVDVAVQGGASIADDVAFAQTSPYRTVPIGTWTVDVTPSAGSTAGATAALPVDITGNANYTVLLLDRGGRLELELHQDSAGAATVPVGGIETGLGGTAGAAGPQAAGPVTVAACAVAASAVLLLLRARRAARR